MTTSSSAALVLEDATAAFGATTALDGVTGLVPRGGSVALIGPNGAGKTTLIRAIVGAVPLVRGRIEVLGTTPKRARGRVAYVPQADSLDAQFPIDALGVVLMGRYRTIGWLRRAGASDRAAARAALARVGLDDLAKTRFGALSGGQRQRVLLARAIAQEAELLLLDEPFNGVDSLTTDLVVDVLAQLRAEGAAVVMSTHDLAVAHLTCDDACLLNTHQVAFGPIRDTLTPHRLQHAYGHGAIVLADGATFVSTR